MTREFFLKSHLLVRKWNRIECNSLGITEDGFWRTERDKEFRRHESFYKKMRIVSFTPILR